MSAFPNNTFAAVGVPLYLANPVQYIQFAGSPPINVSNSNGILLANGVDLNTADWSLYPTLSNKIIMDASNVIQILGNDLYFNNELIALASNVSNISDWSLYVALCNVDLDTKGILFGSNLLSNIGTTLYFAGNPLTSANWSTFPATQNVNMSNFSLTNTNTVSGPAGNSNLNLTSSSNVVIAASNAITQTADIVQITATEINPLNTPAVSINSSNGFQGQINLTAGAGLAGIGGEINLTAQGGSLGGIGYGGLIEMVATTPVGISNVTSAIKSSAASITSYAGITSAIGSTFGYNYLHGDIGVNITAGLIPTVPNFAGTVYIYGTAGTEIDNGLYVDHIYPYSDTLTFPNLRITGNSLTGADVEISNVVQFAGDNLGMTGINSITMTGTSVIGPLNILNMSNGIISNLSNVNGIAYSATCNWANFPAISDVNMSNRSISNVSNINGVLYTPTCNWANFSAVSNVNMNSNSINTVNQLKFTGQSNTGLQRELGWLGVGYDAVSTIINPSGSNGDFRTNGMILTDKSVIYPSNISNDIMLQNAGTISGVQRIGAAGSNLNQFLAYLDDIPMSHGSFWSTVNQSQATSNIPNVFTYTNSNAVVGLTESAGKIYSTNGGTYLINFSIQFARTSGGGSTTAEAWVRLNGVDVPDTNTRILLASAGNGETVMTVPLNLDLTAGQYFEIVMGTPDYTTTIAQAFPARTTPYVAPAIPSIILTIDQVG